MPETLIDLKRFENSKDIEYGIINYLRGNTREGFTLQEIESELMQNKIKGMKIRGNFVINNILRKMVNKNRIKSIISHAKEYFYILDE